MAGRGRPSRATVYERLEAALRELNQRLGGLPNPHEAQAIWDDIWHQEAHHSTALEGNTLVLREVQAGEAIRRNRLTQPLPEALARVHNQFEQVHPFLDGNGRAGRLLLNLMLIRLGYPPVIIFKRQRDAYLAAMQRADDGDYGAMGELIARAMYDNLNRFILPNVAGPARLVPLQALVRRELSLAALRQAAQRGRLEAVQGADGIWRSNRKAVDAYLKTRKRRAARPGR